MNLFGPACPACGGEPISLWQKLGSRPGRSFACQSCGTPLRLGMPGFRQFLLPAFVGTLASFAPDILAGVGIFILALVLLARGLPVEAAPAESAGPKSSPALVGWFLGVVAVGILSLRVSFFPAPEVAMAGLGVAILMSYLMTRRLWADRDREEERKLLYPLSFLLLVFMHYLSFAVVLPAWPAYQLGETRAFQTRVVHKGGSHRLGTCKTQIRLDTANLFSNWSLCLPEAQWNTLKEGDGVVVTSASSWLGDYVLHVVPATGAAAR